MVLEREREREMGGFDFPFIQTLFAIFLILLAVSDQKKMACEAIRFASFPTQITDNTEYLKVSCSATSYPRLCFNSLSGYATKIKTNPKTLALAALHVNLAAARSTSEAMRKLSRTHGLRRREASAISDCVEEVTDSVYELQRSIRELGRTRNSDFGALISDIETWVSSALTDEDTCMDGFGGGGRRAINGIGIKVKVRRHIVKVAHLTSNSLALVNKYASASAADVLLP